MDEQVAALLQNTLSAAAQTRIQAELSLKELHKTGEAALSLARICLAQNADVALRQSAGINLKKYVKEHWSAAFETFEGNPPSTEIKDQIRQAVFAGLSDSIRKIRLACAGIVSEIASSDWPDEWPNLLESLVQLLNSGKTESVHGAMRVLSDFVSTDLSEDQLLPLSNAMLPQLLRILGDERFSPTTRAQSVAVFNQCISTLYMVKESHPQAAKYATEQVIPQWADAFRFILSSDPSAGGDWSSLHIRNEIFTTLDTILVSFPKSINTQLEAFLTDAARHITILAGPFRSTMLHDDLDTDFSLETEDDTSLTLPNVLSTILLFIANASRKGNGKTALVSKLNNEATELLQQIVYLSVYYAQITTEDEERWTNDLNAFVEDEDDEMPAPTLRTASLDLVQSFLNSFRTPTMRALASSVERITQESDKLREANQQDWWKGYESALEHLSSAAEDINEHLQECQEKQQPSIFHLEQLFGRLVAPFLSSPELPFLQGRALIFASRFATQLPQNLQQQFFESSLQLFEAQDTSFVLKICALRALKNFCQQIPDSPTFASLGNRITSDLLPLISQAREGTLMLIMETLERTLKLGTIQQDQQLCNDVVSATIQPVINGSLKNPAIQATLCDLVRVFASSPAENVYNSLLNVGLPRLAELLCLTGDDDDTRQQVISSITVINAIFDGRPSPIGPGLFATVGQALFDTLNRTDDDNVLQDGLDCLTYVVRKDVNQLIQWYSANGQSGLEALFNIVAMVLQPDRSESASLFVGDLLLHVFRRAGEVILPILPDLLRALVTRLTTAKTSTFIQSLILPFAYLMHSQTDTVLDLLESVNIDGRNGVEILLPAWTENVDSILGFWNIRISTVALSKLILTNRASINKLTVKGDLIVNAANSGRIMTRSRSQKSPDQYTQIPFKAKAFRIILKELEQNTEAVELEQSPHDDEGGDGDEWEDNDEAEGPIDISHFIGGPADFVTEEGEDEGDEGDEDLKSDPVYCMDMAAHLRETVKAFASQDRPAFEACVHYLDASELHTLHSI